MKFEGITSIQLLNQYIQQYYSSTDVLILINDFDQGYEHPAVQAMREELRRWDYDLCKAMFRHDYIILELANCPTLVDNLFKIANAHQLRMRFYHNGALKARTYNT